MTHHPITLLFADGVTRTVQAQTGQKLVEVAASLGLSLLTDCSNGQCGTCAAHCISGRMALDDYDPSVLPDDERDDGAILCCVARVEGPAVIELPYDASDASGEEAPGQLGTVVQVRPVAKEIVQFTVSVPDPVAFLAGQYVRLKAEGMSAPRSYSMANGSESDTLDFYVRLVEGGEFSTWLTERARPGDRIEVSAPRGSFFLRDNQSPRLLVAGGSGLAPMLAMLRRMVDAANTGTDAAQTRLLIGARSGAQLFATEELQALQAQLPNLSIQVAVETEAPMGAHIGYPTDLIGADGLAPNTQIYVCGPPPMVDAARAAALKAGARKSDVLCERFN